MQVSNYRSPSGLKGKEVFAKIETIRNATVVAIVALDKVKEERGSSQVRNCGS